MTEKENPGRETSGFHFCFCLLKKLAPFLDRFAFEKIGKGFGFGFRFQFLLVHLHGLILERNDQKAKGCLFGDIDFGIESLSPFFGKGHLSAPELLED